MSVRQVIGEKVSDWEQRSREAEEQRSRGREDKEDKGDKGDREENFPVTNH
jgi:hypothetical protein